MAEVKRNLPKIIKENEGHAVAILNHNKAEAYLVPAALYEKLITNYEEMQNLQDLQDTLLVKQRENGSCYE